MTEGDFDSGALRKDIESLSSHPEVVGFKKEVEESTKNMNVFEEDLAELFHSKKLKHELKNLPEEDSGPNKNTPVLVYEIPNLKDQKNKLYLHIDYSSVGISTSSDSQAIFEKPETFKNLIKVSFGGEGYSSDALGEPYYVEYVSVFNTKNIRDQKKADSSAGAYNLTEANKKKFVYKPYEDREYSNDAIVMHATSGRIIPTHANELLSAFEPIRTALTQLNMPGFESQ